MIKKRKILLKELDSTGAFTPPLPDLKRRYPRGIGISGTGGMGALNTAGGLGRAVAASNEDPDAEFYAMLNNPNLQTQDFDEEQDAVNKLAARDNVDALSVGPNVKKHGATGHGGAAMFGSGRLSTEALEKIIRSIISEISGTQFVSKTIGNPYKNVGKGSSLKPDGNVINRNTGHMNLATKQGQGQYGEAGLSLKPTADGVYGHNQGHESDDYFDYVEDRKEKPSETVDDEYHIIKRTLKIKLK